MINSDWVHFCVVKVHFPVIYGSSVLLFSATRAEDTNLYNCNAYLYIYSWATRAVVYDHTDIPKCRR